MYEVLSRRFRRGRVASEQAASDAEAGVEPDSEREWQLPDLFVVDGGRGQLGVALTAAHDLGLHDLAIVGLAKEKESPLGGDKLVDRVYLPGQKNAIPLRPNSPELFMLARARDEAHRFSNRGRKKVGKRRRLGSELDTIAGIGPKTRVALLKQLGSVSALAEASDEQILAIPGVTRRQLSALRTWLEARKVRSTPENADADEFESSDELESDESTEDGADEDPSAIENPSDNSVNDDSLNDAAEHSERTPE
jgi:excinuclease ABC subunit C